MSLRTHGSLGVSVLVALTPLPAAAAAVALSYSAPDGPACPSQTQFVEALRARGAELDSATAAARASAVDVSIRWVNAAYVGELTVHSPDAGAATRTVHDPDCAEVATGLALTAAIALGGEEVTPAEPASAEAPHPPQGAEARAAAAPPTEAPSTPAVSEPIRRWRGSSFDRVESLDLPAGKLELKAARAYTLRAGAAVGLIPGEIVPRYELDASLASFLGLPDGESRLFGPLLQVHWAVHGPVTTRHAGGVSLDTWGLEAGISSCSALTYDTAGWVSLLCGEFGAGWLFSDGSLPGGNRFDASSGYGYAGLGLDVQYNFGSMLHLGLRAGGRLSTRVSVDTPDATRLFESSAWGGYATVGLGLHF